ncbi:cAMP-dependent protein kinase type II regulatory subunit isoform X2 [Tropilaelaps mercedesae]|uniref:cAMP-dependent protein kinase type II regulatory subunit isoform X2 n=1 Tax=Tropilaelaps mercedesae TaxID=418985 RepID=A0A1V9XHS9_9ACAR|nr:cAMP-dependent protein kinase type II regulatory subunit isoform X2 [Tropilaelaps mercedesae]
MEPVPTDTRGRRKAVCGESYDPATDKEAIPEAPPKSAELRENLLRIASENVVFMGLDDRQMKEVVDHLAERIVKAGEVIVKQGDPGDYFYIIDSGKFEVTVNGATVNSYDGKGSFGELALYYDQPRVATVTAATDGKMWQIDRAMFRRLVLRKAHELRQEYDELISSVPILESLSPNERLVLCDALIPRLYKNGDIIIKQGEAADGMYFLEQGEVTVTVKAKDGKEEQVSTLSRGSYFGELSLLSKQPRAATVIAKGSVRTAFLHVATFERLLGKCVDVMRRNIPHYEAQIIKIFGSKESVEGLR